MVLSLIVVGLPYLTVEAQEEQGPTVTIENPDDDATVNGSIQVSGTASDTSDSVETVEVKIDDGAWNATSGTSSWSYEWDTTTVSDGEHTITARATNTSGSNSRDTHTVTVDNTDEPPTVTIDSPDEGATVSGSVDVAGTASDPDGEVQTVEVRIDGGAWNATSGTSSWSYTWDTTTGVSDGEHTVEARSYDGESHSSVASRTVTVDNGGSDGSTDQAPTITIDKPQDGATVKDSVVVEGTASDPEGDLQTVEVSIDGGTWQTASGTSSWTYTWDTTDEAEGQHTIEARSYDGGNHSQVDKHVVTVDNEGSSSTTNAAPNIQIDQPGAGATVSGTIDIRGSASDPDGSVSFVLVRIDDSDWREASGTTVWEQSWETTPLANGEHVIYAKAYDDDGRIGIASRTITVDNVPDDTNQTNQTDANATGNDTTDRPPEVTFQEPSPGAEVEGQVTLKGQATEPDAGDQITVVQVRVDDRRWNNASGTGSWAYIWDASTVEPGEHTLQARASDGTQWSPLANLTVHVNGTGEALEATGQASGNGSAPTLILERPEEGASVGGELTLAGTVEDGDANGTLEVHARISGGPWETFEVEPGQPFEKTLSLDGVAPGQHTVDIRAYDGASYSQTESVSIERSGSGGQVAAGIFVVLLALGGIGLWAWSRQGSST